MSPEALLLLLIVLACPLMMVFMMRGGHGSHGAHSMHDDVSGDTGEHTALEAASLDELRSQQNALASEIARRESRDALRPTDPAQT